MIRALDIDEIHAPGALAGLAPEWWDLWQRAPAATPFQSPAWLIAWWMAFAPGDLLAVTVRRRGRLVGLAPLYVEDGRDGPRLLPVGVSLSDYVDILVDPEVRGVECAIVDHLVRCGASWVAWEMAGLLPDAAARALPCPAPCSRAVERADTCPVLSLSPGCADAAIHPAVPARQRRKLRMARHRLSRSPGAAIVETHELAPRQWLDALVETHTTRWQGRGLPGVLADPRAHAFHADALAGLVERGIARLFALRIGGAIAGVYYGFVHRRRGYAYLGGFDPRFAYYSPGAVLLGHAIEDAMREGVRELHLLRGGEAYKYAWGAVDRQTLKLTFVRPPGCG